MMWWADRHEPDLAHLLGRLTHCNFRQLTKSRRTIDPTAGARKTTRQPSTSQVPPVVVIAVVAVADGGGIVVTDE
jgi:hypothetical protein